MWIECNSHANNQKLTYIAGFSIESRETDADVVAKICLTDSVFTDRFAVYRAPSIGTQASRVTLVKYSRIGEVVEETIGDEILDAAIESSWDDDRRDVIRTHASQE